MMKRAFQEDVLDTIAGFLSKRITMTPSSTWGGRRNMVLTPGYIKVIAKEIASQIITELKKPLKKSFSKVGSVGVCEVSCCDKDTLIDYFKNHERRTHEKIENERRKN